MDAIALLLAAVAAAPTTATGGELTATPLALDPAGPGAAGARYPRLARGADGALLLCWTEKDGEGARVRYAALEQGGFAPARELVESRELFVNWADAPAVTADGAGRVRGVWLEALAAGPYAYGARLGAPGGEPRWLHDDQSAAEHGFVSLAPRADGVDLVWLDGRGVAASHGGGGATALFLRALGADGALGPEVELDPRVCDCCQTALARLSDGTLIAAYRDRGEDERRDVSFVRIADGKASEPAPVHADGWKIDGCPVNGPALAARGDRVACAWYTEAGSPRVLLAVSEPGARAFGPPQRVDGAGPKGAPLGRVDVAWLADGSLLVSHLVETDAEEARGAWVVRRWRDGGFAGAPLELAPADTSRRSGFLRLAADGAGAVAAWTETEPELALRAARVAVGG